MIKWLLKKKSICVPVLVYLAVFIVFVASGFINYFTDKALQQKGALAEQALTINDFTHEAFIEAKQPWEDFINPIVSTDSDPQLVLQRDMYINGLSFKMRTHIPSGEVVLYYKTEGQTGFSEKQRILPIVSDTVNGVYEFSFDTKHVSEIRLDAVSVGACVVEITDITLNTAKTFFQYFVIDVQAVIFVAFAVPVVYLAIMEALQIIKNKPFKKG